MAQDPNPNLNRPDLQTPPPARKSMTPWFVVAAVVVAGLVAWSLMSGPSTDPATTSATPPVATETAPAVEPTTPAPATPPAATTPAPATPNSGTTQP